MEVSAKKCSTKKNHEYIPHKLRSRPLRCIAFPAITSLIFIAYWFIICPLVYVSILNEKLNDPKSDSESWVPLFWGMALLIFIIIMAVLICIWRCVKSQEKEQEIIARRKDYDTMLNTSNFDGKQLYHVSLIQPQEDKAELVEIPKRKLHINILNNEQNVRPRSEVINRSLPRSEISTKSLPRSPLTPRELFFIDLIEAVNSSPIAMIPPTQNFIENERKDHLPHSREQVEENFPACSRIRNKSESEYFIANVADRKSLIATEAFLYVDEVPGEKEFAVTQENDTEEVFLNN